MATTPDAANSADAADTAELMIAALRSGHDELAALAAGLTDDDLALTSGGASEWDVAQVLSHLGSGAEITQAVLQSAIDGAEAPGNDVNHSVWDRWNAMSRREQADGFVAASEELTRLYESLDADTRGGLRIVLSYLPAPIDVATHARMRLNELTHHSWDLRVTFDEQTSLHPDAVPLLLHDTSLLGWIAKSEPLGGNRSTLRVETQEPAEVFTLVLDEKVAVDFVTPPEPDGMLALPAEAWLRLVSGRLSPEHTPADVRTDGAADLDLLRRVFPGY